MSRFVIGSATALALLLSACDTTPPAPPMDAPSARPSAQPETAAPPARPTAETPSRPAATAPRPAATSFSDEPAKLTLTSGATLVIPPPVRVKANTTATKRLPDVVKQAKVFELGDDKRLLMVNELDMQGKSCAALISEQAAKMKAAEGDQDEKRLQFRRQQSSEVVKVGGHDVLFGQAMHKGVSATDDQPFVGSASAVMCRDGNYVLVMFMARTEEKAGAPRKLLLDVIESFEASG